MVSERAEGLDLSRAEDIGESTVFSGEYAGDASDVAAHNAFGAANEGETDRQTRALLPSYLTLKRLLDQLLCLAALPFAIPLGLIIAAAVKVSSRGPILFCQTRTGRNGKSFRLYKFRSMHVALQDASGIKSAVKDDPRITAIGQFIRRTGLDELPQLLNVLAGDMSFVGPRPQVIGMRVVGLRYEDVVPNYGVRHVVPPGLTGLAQVRGFRGHVEDIAHARARIASDLEYIGRASLCLDLKILALTVPSLMFGRFDA